MQRTRVYKTVAAAGVLAAVAGVVGMAGVGCRALSGGAGQATSAAEVAASRGAAALAQGSAGVQAIASQTQVAEKQVQKALPHSDVKGQAYLEAASDAHAVALASTGQVEAALAVANRQVTELRQQVERAAGQVQQEQQRYSKLAEEWYVVWGLRVERVFWTVATVWLVGSAASILLGAGNPIGWIAGLRGMIASTRQRWIGEAFVK